MEIGKRIKNLRMKNGLTQAQLAEELGVTAAAVGNYEQGISFPKECVLEKMFKVLDCTPNELLSDEKFSETDREHFRMYLMLDENGKRAVDKFTECELSKAGTIKIAARSGASGITLKKRGNKSIFDAKDYNI